MASRRRSRQPGRQAPSPGDCTLLRRSFRQRLTEFPKRKQIHQPLLPIPQTHWGNACSKFLSTIYPEYQSFGGRAKASKINTKLLGSRIWELAEPWDTTRFNPLVAQVGKLRPVQGSQCQCSRELHPLGWEEGTLCHRQHRRE